MTHRFEVLGTRTSGFVVWDNEEVCRHRRYANRDVADYVCDKLNREAEDGGDPREKGDDDGQEYGDPRDRD